jgi:hypothetical protein
MLSGCDYLKSPRGVGLKKAFTLLEEHKTVSKVIQVLRAKNSDCMPEDYEVKFERAFLAFRYQRVWCPITGQQVYLNNLPEDQYDDQLDGKNLKEYIPDFLEASKFSYEKRLLSLHKLDEIVGPKDDPQIARLIAEGLIHPVEKTPFKPSEYCCFRNGCVSKQKTQFLTQKPALNYVLASQFQQLPKLTLFSQLSGLQEGGLFFTKKAETRYARRQQGSRASRSGAFLKACQSPERAKPPLVDLPAADHSVTSGLFIPK